MVSNIVKDVFSRGFISVSEEDTLSVCLSLFKGEMPPVLAVVDSRGKYKGVLARRWIIRSRLDPNTTKAKSLVRSAPTVTLNESLSKTSRLMIGSEIRQLPVYSGEKLLGFVTDENVIHGAVLEKWGNTNVEEVMNKNPFFVKEDDSVGTVLSLFREKGISHAPVVSNENLIGIIGIHDIIEHTFKPKQRQTLGERVGDTLPVLNILVKGIMVKNVITVSPETKLREAAEKMHKFNISSLVVVKNRTPVGIVTKRDFLEPLAQMDVEMRRLTVQFSLKDIEVDETQRGLIMNNFESFAHKYEETLGAGTLFIYMKTHGTIYKGDQLIHCRLQLRTKKGSFFSSSEEWSVEQTFRIALNRLEKQIRPRK